MLNPLFPQQADNAYRGSRIALVFFALVVLLKLVIGLSSIFNGHEAASSADGIPLDTFTPAGAQAVVSLFASLGLRDVVICLLCVLALIRYRTLVPFRRGRRQLRRRHPLLVPIVGRSRRAC